MTAPPSRGLTLQQTPIRALPYRPRYLGSSPHLWRFCCVPGNFIVSIIGVTRPPPPPNMTNASDHDIFGALEREKQTIWATHLTDLARQNAWSQRRAQLLSFLKDDEAASYKDRTSMQGPQRTQALPPVRPISVPAEGARKLRAAS